MARADLLLDLVRAGARGDQPLFRKTLEAMVADERAKHHHVLADRLASHLQTPGAQVHPIRPAPHAPHARDGGLGDLFHDLIPVRTLDDLVLPESVATACLELVEEQHRSDLLRSHNLEPRHRVLLAGAPGNGKTSLAEAIAASLAVPLLVVRYEAVIASYLGETALRMARLFEQVRTRRCVLFFDEFDVVGKERGDLHETGEIKRVVSSLLLQIDALPSYVVVVTATNHPELLDRAVWRRFQLRMELPQPSVGQIEQWFRRFEERAGFELGVPATVIAKALAGASFSELEQFAQDVLRRAVLAQTEGNVKRIVTQRLQQWRSRFTVGRKARTRDRDA